MSANQFKTQRMPNMPVVVDVVNRSRHRILLNSGLPGSPHVELPPMGTVRNIGVSALISDLLRGDPVLYVYGAGKAP